LIQHNDADPHVAVERVLVDLLGLIDARGLEVAAGISHALGGPGVSRHQGTVWEAEANGAIDALNWVRSVVQISLAQLRAGHGA